MKFPPSLWQWIKAWRELRLADPRTWSLWHETEAREWLDEAARRREQQDHDRIRQERDPRGGEG